MSTKQDFPMLPVLSWTDLRRMMSPRRGDGQDTDNLRFLASGRFGIALALRDQQVGEGDEVLLPAYHCMTMVDPIRWSGAKPVYYRINEDMTPNLADLESLISDKTRAILAAHLFGVHCDFHELRSICSTRDIFFIEDCAHTIFGLADCGSVGSYGDYVIASPRKFFPIQDGGVLSSRRRSLAQIKLQHLGLRNEFKVLLNTLEYSGAFARLGRLGSFASFLGGIWPKARSGDKDSTDPKKSSRSHAVSSPVDKIRNPIPRFGRISYFSRRVLRSLSVAEVVAARRRNYQGMLDRLSSLSRGTPMFPRMPKDFTPYVFLMEIKEPEEDHAALRAAGVPVWRWDELDTSICEQSNKYSRSLIQIPCHQGLTADELEQMIGRVRDVLK